MWVQGQNQGGGHLKLPETPNYDWVFVLPEPLIAKSTSLVLVVYFRAMEAFEDQLLPNHTRFISNSFSFKTRPNTLTPLPCVLAASQIWQVEILQIRRTRLLLEVRQWNHIKKLNPCLAILHQQLDIMWRPTPGVNRFLVLPLNMKKERLIIGVVSIGTPTPCDLCRLVSWRMKEQPKQSQFCVRMDYQILWHKKWCRVFLKKMINYKKKPPTRERQ